MSSLLDIIKQNLGGTQNTAPQLGETGRIQDVLRTKSGKASTATGPKGSSLLEKSTAQQAALGGQQLQQKGKILGAQQAEQGMDIVQREAIQQKKYEHQRSKQKSNFDRMAFNSLDEFNRGIRRLDNAKDISELEQIGVVMRLGNEQYINKLQQEGQKARFDNELAYKEQAAREAFADSESLLKDDLAFKSMINMSEREFAEEMSQIDINLALEIASDTAKTENAQMISQGIGSIVSETTSYGEKEGWFKDSKTPSSAAGSIPFTETNVSPVDGPQMSPIGGRTQSSINWWE